MLRLRERSRVWWMVAAGSAALLATPAFSLLVQPVVIRMQSAGRNASAAITVVNDRNRPDTVEIKMAKVGIPEKGPIQLTPDPGNDFLVFPPIATIQPGKTQVFRIRWVGDPVLAEARSYMFTTSELPVEQQGTGVQLVYAIQSLVTVSSPNLTSDVQVVDVRRGTRDVPASQTEPAHTEQGLEVTFANPGTDVAFASDYAMHAEIGGTPWKLDASSAQIQQYVGLGLIAPKSRRQLFLSIPNVPPSGDVKITFKHDNRR